MQHASLRGTEFVRTPEPADLRRTADILVDILADAGVEVVFGLPGSSIAPIDDALMDRRDMRKIVTRHEAGAAFAAAGYARATGKIGVVAVTSGPGIINALTGLASAHADGLPLLVLAGEVPQKSYGRGGLQETSPYSLDIVRAAKSMCKLAIEVRDSNSAPAILRRAIATALSGARGPVLLTLPMNVTTAPIRTPLMDVNPRVVFDLAPSTVASVSAALASSERGLLFVGSGARNGDGPARVRDLAEKLQMPVMTTPKAKGVFPESHPLSLGVFGWGGHASAVKYLSGGIDTLMAIGTGLGEAATNNWSSLLAPTKHFIHLDAEAQRIGRSYPVTMGVAGLVDDTLAMVLDRLHLVDPRRRPKRRFGVERKDTGDRVLVGEEQRIAPQRALWELQQLLPRNTLFSADMGDHTFFALHHLEIDQPDGFVSMLGLASMQSGIGAAVGMQAGRPDRTVVAVCGDGCFMMGVGDVATAARENLPMIVAVLNDEKYGMVEAGHQAAYGRHPDYPSGPVDIAALARSIGADSAVIEKPNQLRELGLARRSRTVPMVLDIRIDRTIRIARARVDFIKDATQKASN